jgi:hypothetical protein
MAAAWLQCSYPLRDSTTRQAHLRALGGQELAEADQSARHPKGWHGTAYPVSSDGDRTLGSRDWLSASIRRCAVSSTLS